MKDPIHVAACCDENYIAFAAVMMLSALKSTPNTPIHFHLINCGVTRQSIDKLKQMVGARNGELTTYTPDDSLYEGLPTLRYSAAVYQRINLPEYIPAEIKRIIYIDSDTLVLGDLKALWETDLQGRPVAAVENLSPRACQDIGFERKDYFNSGLLVMDLDAWRTEKLHLQVTDYARHHAANLQFVDQCSLNAVLQGRWSRLPLKWNQQSDIYKVVLKYYEGCTYSRDEMQDAMINPGIVHFTGKMKPWKLYSFHPFKLLYRQVLAETPWPVRAFPDDSVKTRLRFYLALRRNWKSRKRRALLPIQYQGK